MKGALVMSLAFYLIGVSNCQSPQRFGIDSTEKVPAGLPLLSKAPDFKAIDQNGTRIHLYDILADKKVVLFFYRGNWCPFCNTYLQNMQDSLDLILDKNAVVIAVSPENQENIQKTTEKYSLGFHVIGDSGGRIMTDYDVLFNVTKGYQTKMKLALFMDIAAHNDQETARLPVPATYVIDKDGTIIFRHFNIDFRQRAPISEIIRHL